MSNNGPPIFPDHDKFNGTNWLAWKNMITIAAEVRGAMGYLTGIIQDPTSQTTTTIHTASSTPIITVTSPAQTTMTATTTTSTPTPTTTTETAWDSGTPSTSEWKAQNAWAKGLVIYNIRNPVGLGVNVLGSASEAWTSLTSIYDKTTELALLHAQDELQGLRYRDGDNFPNHITQLRVLWQNANAMGANINDATFRTIILASLPNSWNPIVAATYGTTTSVDAIAQLSVHWMRISRDRGGNQNPNAPTALQTTYNRGGNRPGNGVVCSNPNCCQPGHAVEDCYWPGGGKQGQFPPNFGRRRTQQQA
ncbi:hypothetical protein AN958_07124 [Leucoagaricus sp. SymC.cos]|nr:hypothetical protein AN958_07124 [Leucoagaricus sp. SymC.cos]